MMMKNEDSKYVVMLETVHGKVEILVLSLHQTEGIINLWKNSILSIHELGERVDLVEAGIRD